MADTDTQQPKIIAVSAVMLFLSTASVALRLLARYKSGVGFWWDDWCAIFATVISYSLNIVQFIGVHFGLGRHTTADPHGLYNLSHFLLSLYSVEPFYSVCMPAIKFTMVLFYWRTFGTGNKNLRRALIGTSVLLLMWLVGTMFGAIFQCTPIERYWHPEIDGHCIDPYIYFVAISSANLLTDVIVLVLPLRVVWNLNITLRQKIALTGVFALGGFVTIVSIIRIISLRRYTHDPLWIEVDNAVWTAVETSVGVVSVNVPVMAPLVRRFLTHKGRTSNSSKFQPTHSGSNHTISTYKSRVSARRPDRDSQFIRMQDSVSDHRAESESGLYSSAAALGVHDIDLPVDENGRKIWVTQEVDVDVKSNPTKTDELDFAQILSSKPPRAGVGEDHFIARAV